MLFPTTTYPSTMYLAIDSSPDPPSEITLSPTLDLTHMQTNAGKHIGTTRMSRINTSFETQTSHPPRRGFNIPQRHWCTINHIRTSMGRWAHCLNEWKIKDKSQYNCGQFVFNMCKEAGIAKWIQLITWPPCRPILKLVILGNLPSKCSRVLLIHGKT